MFAAVFLAPLSRRFTVPSSPPPAAAPFIALLVITPRMGKRARLFHRWDSRRLGDVTLVTPLGKFIAGMTTVIGLALYAPLVGIIANGSLTSLQTTSCCALAALACSDLSVCRGGSRVSPAAAVCLPMRLGVLFGEAHEE